MDRPKRVVTLTDAGEGVEDGGGTATASAGAGSRETGPDNVWAPGEEGCAESGEKFTGFKRSMDTVTNLPFFSIS